MEKTKVLYITYDGLTDPLGQSQIIPYLAGLSQKGYSITIISCEKKQRKNQLETVKQILTANNIKWLPVSYTKKPPVLSTIYDIWRVTRTAQRENKKTVFNIVHCRSYIPALIGLRMKKRKGVKFIFDMRGFWADERVEGNIWNLRNPVFKAIYSYFKKKEIDFFKNADAIVSLTQNAKNEILSWKSLPKSIANIDVIPCCVDMELFNPDRITPQQVASLKNQLGVSQDEFILSYVGSLGTWYLLDEMLDFFRELLNSKPSAKFLFITNDPSENILNKAKGKGIPTSNVLIRRANRNEMPLFIKTSNLSLFFIKQSFSKKASSPVKQGEIMSMGVPLICNTGVGDTDKIVENSGSGFCITKFTNEQYIEAISKIPTLSEISPKKIREGAAKYYSLQNGVSSYTSIYKRLTDK